MTRKLVESIRKDAHETSKKLYNKLIHLDGLKPHKQVMDEEDGAEFTIYDDKTDFVFSIGRWRDYTDGNHWNLWISPVSTNDHDLKVPNYLQQNLSEQAILDFSDDLYNYGPYAALKNAGFNVKYISRYDENYTMESLQEALGDERFNKIRKLITECKKEGFGVSISIPKKTLNK